MMNKQDSCTGCGKCRSAQSMTMAQPAVYQDISKESVALLMEEICGTRYVFTDADYLAEYGKDQAMGLQYDFDILVKPASAEQISEILKVCNKHGIPILPRGGGSGVTGGAVPCKGGIVLSLERLNAILSISDTDGYVIAESGVITDDLCNAVAAHGLYFPVAPTSSAYSFIGGNVAENAGSVRSCKYGTTADYVLNMEVVLPSGTIIWTGANVMKNSSGFNLTQLFTGSEGVLGIITKVVYKLLPAPVGEVVLLTAFGTLEEACEAVIAIKRSGLQPSVVELICRNALDLTTAVIPGLPVVHDRVAAQLLIELQALAHDHLTQLQEQLAVLLEKYTSEPILAGESASEKEHLRKLRSSIGSAMSANGGKYRDIDMSVPLSHLYAYIREVESICRQYDVQLVCFGHAMDGNLHTMLLLPPQMPDEQEKKFNKAVSEIYRYGVSKGGVISGEHGIGLLQKEFMRLQFPEAHLSLMKGIKTMFDPNGILNPGKIFY
jgi:glycolate oxidase